MKEARIITFASKKGGGGKSTACMSLAAELARRGASVLVVDADSQASSLGASRAAPDDQPFPATVLGISGAGSKLAREIQPHAGHHDFILVDTEAGTAFEATQSAILVSDLVVIPVRPSGADIRALADMFKLLDQVESFTGAKPNAVLLPTQLRRDGLTKAMLSALQTQRVPCLASSLAERSAHAEVLTLGVPQRSSGRGSKDPAVAEVVALADEVLKILKCEDMKV